LGDWGISIWATKPWKLFDERFERGDYRDYGEDSIHELSDDVKARGRKRLAEEEADSRIS
jgi:hypothetical protein